MKAPSSKASGDDGAEDSENDEELEFDYQDFFSILMFYGHMSKQDIMNSSRPFLHGIYRMYVKRACENLGVSSDGEDDKENDDNVEEDRNGYPTDFLKLSPKEQEDTTRNFLASFPGASVFKDASIIVDKHE